MDQSKTQASWPHVSEDFLKIFWEYFPHLQELTGQPYNHRVFNHAIGTVGNPEGQELFDHFMEAKLQQTFHMSTDSTALWIDLSSVFRFVANR